ncbi:hypothetical protein HOLleu_30630 [Holothuria leucospilota]|uniref:Centrosomal protein of 135 kDa n=1 Tax=Holothuria leucospilota TaxID=206669 RepID=A0A9Q1H0P0_HOLLE|nr:hypothetical protein HOLleu_30630 [Holothuria leucospilota]
MSSQRPSETFHVAQFHVYPFQINGGSSIPLPVKFLDFETEKHVYKIAKSYQLKHDWWHSKMSGMAEAKFITLRKRLDQLGYKQPLGLESLPLVEKLFNDLIHTTESLKEAKLKVSHPVKVASRWEEHVEPYRNENAKLVRENNELHQQLIRLQEDLQSTSQDLKGSVRKLEHENADLRFLNSQYVHKVRALEQDAKSKADRILKLQEKNLHAVVQTPGGKKRNIPFRRQRMDIDSTVPPSDQTWIPSYSYKVDDPYVADFLSVADNQMEILRNENEHLKEAKEINLQTIKNLQKQVDAREREIQRLNRLLEGGKPEDVIINETRERSNERLVSHLNIQIDYLQQANRDLEQKLTESRKAYAAEHEKVVELTSRKEQLAQELKEVDRLAKRLQADRDTALHEADEDVSQAKQELRKSVRENEDRQLELEQLRQERKNLLSDLSNIKTDLLMKEKEVTKLQDLVDSVQDDKSRLSEKVNKLASSERELVLELERIRKKNKSKTNEVTSKIEDYMRTIEEERDYYKGEVEVLNRILKSRPESLRNSIREGSPLRSSKGKNRKPGSPSRSPAKLDKKSAAHYESLLRVLEDERDFYKQEYETMKSLRTSQMRTTSSPQSPQKNKSYIDESEIIILRNEKEKLQLMVDKLERHLAEVQSNVKVLSSERDKLNILYEQSNEEVQRLRKSLMNSPMTKGSTVAAQSILQRLESERDEVIADLRRMTTERDSLRERLKIATETHLSDKARLQQQVEDLEQALQTSQQDLSGCRSRIPNLQGMISTLEEQVRSLNLRAEEAREEASQNKANSTQMRLLAEQAELASQEHQKRLTNKSGELLAAEERMARLESRLADVNAQNSNLREEIDTLRSKVASVDRERDNLQIVVDEKTEQVLMLERQVSEKSSKIEDQRISQSDLGARLENANTELGSREREIHSLRRQIDLTRQELNETIQTRDNTIRENRRLQEDLATMTKENQTINRELEEVIADRESLKSQVQDYISEVARFEDLLATKEQEYRDLLDNYRSVSDHAQRWETEASKVSSQSSNLQLEVAAKESDLRSYQEQANQLQRELDEQVSLQQGYEMQVSNLTRSLQTMEENMRQLQEEKEALVQDLAAVRDLCAKLDSTKDSLSRQLTSKTIDCEQTEAAMEDLNQEVEMLRNQVSTERNSVRNLENLLSANREKDFQVQLENQEQRSEIQLVKDRLSLADSKVQSQTREIQSLRSRCAQLEADLERQKRQLTSEKFERERLSQELRRSILSPSGSTSLSRDLLGTTSLSVDGKNRSSSPQNLSSRRALSPELLLAATPEKSILKPSPGRRSRSPQRSKSLGFT